MRRVAVLSLGNFFAAGHFFLIIYILAPYLATLMPAAASGLAIALGAVITLSIFPSMPRLVRKYGPRKLGITLASLEILLLLGLASGPGALMAVLLAAMVCSIPPLIGYQQDLLLEAAVQDGSLIGRVRAAFLTSGNIALVLAPIVTSLLLDDSESYWLVFLVAALTLIPFILMMAHDSMPKLSITPEQTDVRSTCLCIIKDRDLRAVALANATLQLFFHLAPLYIPLYLHTELGIPWNELGWIFALMLIPFVLLEYPAGWLADTKLGDKRILAAGFVITALSFAAIGLIDVSTPIIAIAVVLMLTRVGAALIEAMVEGHFFRRISLADASTVSVFRMMRPCGALLAPILGTILLTVGDYSAFFTIMGMCILLFGLLAARSIKDPRPRVHTGELGSGSSHRGRA
jgi:MFS family permease